MGFLPVRFSVCLHPALPPVLPLHALRRTEHKENCAPAAQQETCRRTWEAGGAVRYARRMEQNFIVTDEHGLHARPASVVVKAATPFAADLKLVAAGKSVNLKSLMSVLSMGLTKGSEFTLRAEGGEDAQQALDTVGQALVDQGLAQRA